MSSWEERSSFYAPGETPSLNGSYILISEGKNILESNGSHESGEEKKLDYSDSIKVNIIIKIIDYAILKLESTNFEDRLYAIEILFSLSQGLNFF